MCISVNLQQSGNKQQLRQQYNNTHNTRQQCKTAAVNKIQLLILQTFCVKFYIEKFRINLLCVCLQKVVGFLGVYATNLAYVNVYISCIRICVFYISTFNK